MQCGGGEPQILGANVDCGLVPKNVVQKIDVTREVIMDGPKV